MVYELLFLLLDIDNLEYAVRPQVCPEPGDRTPYLRLDGILGDELINMNRLGLTDAMDRSASDIKESNGRRTGYIGQWLETQCLLATTSHSMDFSEQITGTTTRPTGPSYE